MKTIRTQIALATIGTCTSIAGAIVLSPAAQAACVGGCITLSANTAYSENFNSLASTGTSSTLPTGWYFAESGTNANTTYTANGGGSGTGDTYSYGPASGANVGDRALGSLTSGNLTPNRLGAQFQIGSADPVASFDLEYIGEQWRSGTSTNDFLEFEYSTDATSLITGTWTNVAALNFTPPIQGSNPASALNGNQPPNRVAISGAISLAVPLGNGATFWIRWVDTDRTGTDHGMAVDNFSITARPIPTPVLLPALIGFGVSALRKRKQNAAL